jgi:hypothetical protein
MFRLSREVFLDDRGATTEEGIIMIALAAFAAGFLLVVTSEPVREKLASLVQQALSTTG